VVVLPAPEGSPPASGVGAGALFPSEPSPPEARPVPPPAAAGADLSGSIVVIDGSAGTVPAGAAAVPGATRMTTTVMPVDRYFRISSSSSSNLIALPR
jgi:hypothetical protein